MFKRTCGRQGELFPARKSLRLATLFIPLLATFLQIANTRAASYLLSSARSSASQAQSERQQNSFLTTLAPGSSFVRELSGGQRHVYQFAMSAGQYAKAIVEQRGVDVVAHLFAADGRLIADVDAERTMQGKETVELVAVAAGNYRIELEPSLPKADAGAYAIQLSEAHVATPEERRLDEAGRQYYEAWRLNDAGKLDQAIEISARALETREQILGADHAAVAASLRALAGLYLLKLDAKHADALLQRAAAVTEKISGAESLEYADVLHALAWVAFIKGDHAQSEDLNLRALKIREQVSGPDSLPVASSLVNLGAVYKAMNDLPKAEQSFLRGSSIREKLLGSEHVEVANALNNLGLFYYSAGDLSNAEKNIQRSLSIKEKSLGPTHAQLGPILNNLGLISWKTKDYAKAKSYYERALPIFEKTSGPESDGVASISHNLGIIYKEDGNDYAKAEAYYQRALTIWEKLFGENHTGTALAANSLGILYKDMGDYDRAERFDLRALAINEKLLGKNNHYTSLNLRSLATLYAIKGDVGRAVEYYSRINAIEEKIIRLNLTLGSERQKLAYYTQLQNPDRVITLHVGLAPDDNAARDLAAATVLQRKGRVLDALSENLSALRRRFDPQDQALLGGLGEVNSQLSKLFLSATQKASAEERQTQLNKLEEERERLEAEISRRSAGYYARSQPVTLAAVRAAIPAAAALVEFFVYRPFEWKAKGDQPDYGEPHYVAYVIRNPGDVRWVELGASKEVDALVADLRQALRDPSRGDVRRVARAVDEKVMRPVRALVGDATRLLVSPDGELNLIPLEALVDEQNRYLIQRYAVTYLTSGRDLLRMRVARESRSAPLVVADPSFGDTAAGHLTKITSARKPSSSGSKRRSVTDARALSEIYFTPLGGTAREADTIHTLFPEAQLLTGARATEASVKAVAAPRLLHIATHGFFLQDAGSAPGNSNTQVAARGASRNDGGENPLLRSGLALAGANLRGGSDGDKKGDDGILTALEASGLDLWGTKLVVLSACDTGLGEVRNGEGVYGLRRAFVLAGAESLVMSLWPASDNATRKLMASYYQNLKQGMGRGDSLRQVQLDLLKHDAQLHPFYWANFIQSGDWANLDGKR